MSLVRQECQHPGCNELQTSSDNNYRGQPGVKYYRKWCQKHYEDKKVKNAGFNTLTEYVNSTHPYRKYRKNYCENVDGRLGFKCIYPKKPFKEVTALLQVDHKDGDPNNNEPKNLQTFCPNCHTYKTHINGDIHTPGRKKLSH